MRRGDRFPHNTAELVLSDVAVEQLADFTEAEQLDILAELVRLCEDPAGKHPLHAPLAGWNTVEVLQGHKRCVYKASVVDGVGVIDVLCVGPRSDSEVYDMAVALRDAGILTEGELTDLWDALAVLDLVAEQAGLDGWDYRPEPADEGLQRAAVASGLLSEEQAALLGKDEIVAAMEAGWGPDGPDPLAALTAALERARARAEPVSADDVETILKRRESDRCGVLMPRAKRRCIRGEGHPGPHRAR